MDEKPIGKDESGMARRRVNQFDEYTEEREQRIRNLHLLDYTPAQIAEATRIPLRTTYRYLDRIRREYVDWYRQNKNRKARVSAYYGEMLAKIQRNIQERWVLFYATPTDHRMERNTILDGILKAYDAMRDHLALLAPRLDQAALEETTQELEELARKVRETMQEQAMEKRVHPIGS